MENIPSFPCLILMESKVIIRIIIILDYKNSFTTITCLIPLNAKNLSTTPASLDSFILRLMLQLIRPGFSFISGIAILFLLSISCESLLLKIRSFKFCFWSLIRSFLTSSGFNLDLHVFVISSGKLTNRITFSNLSKGSSNVNFLHLLDFVNSDDDTFDHQGLHVYKTLSVHLLLSSIVLIFLVAISTLIQAATPFSSNALIASVNAALAFSSFFRFCLS